MRRQGQQRRGQEHEGRMGDLLVVKSRARPKGRPDAVRRWGGVDGPPPSRESAANPRERQNPARLPVERGATPGGAPRVGPVVRRGPRWTNGSQLKPERGRCPEMEDWRRKTWGRGVSDTIDARAADERR
ncbi:hypothetical protein NDU88_006291 [Pleurodeles waltl]|uniref:Uncharacterized protein n=1 Tax=Pleurodeles waltl TaxID=8319 RepID=A0AAV7LS40_PLEWA|nr:hypothetical protein NDU88_006291 [Pleurodeles waltl]